jgi:hypothetical protein
MLESKGYQREPFNARSQPEHHRRGNYRTNYVGRICDTKRGTAGSEDATGRSNSVNLSQRTYWPEPFFAALDEPTVRIISRAIFR